MRPLFGYSFFPIIALFTIQHFLYIVSNRDMALETKKCDCAYVLHRYSEPSPKFTVIDGNSPLALRMCNKHSHRTVHLILVLRLYFVTCTIAEDLVIKTQNDMYQLDGSLSVGISNDRLDSPDRNNAW